MIYNILMNVITLMAITITVMSIMFPLMAVQDHVFGAGQMWTRARRERNLVQAIYWMYWEGVIEIWHDLKLAKAQVATLRRVPFMSIKASYSIAAFQSFTVSIVKDMPVETLQMLNQCRYQFMTTNGEHAEAGRHVGIWLHNPYATNISGTIGIANRISPFDLKNTILHEFAHSLVPYSLDPYPYHNTHWQKTAIRIGGTGHKCASFRTLRRETLPTAGTSLGVLTIEEHSDRVEIVMGNHRAVVSK